MLTQTLQGPPHTVSVPARDIPAPRHPRTMQTLEIQPTPDFDQHRAGLKTWGCVTLVFGILLIPDIFVAIPALIVGDQENSED